MSGKRREAMRTKPDRRVSRTRRALKEALTDLILEKGYEAVTVQDVIDRADVGRSTFYAHFIDKDDLLMAILADLDVPGPDTEGWQPDDPAFGWTLELFRHFGSGKRLFRAVASSQTRIRGASPRWIDDSASTIVSELASRTNDETEVYGMSNTSAGYGPTMLAPR